MFYRKHDRVLAPHSDELVTKQEMKDECDINNILKIYQQTGIYTHVSNLASQAVYTDLPDSFDYQDALHTVMRAEDSFSTLPSMVRDHFQNDPAAFLTALTDPSQREKLTEWGVFEKPPTPPAREPVEPSANPTGRSAATRAQAPDGPSRPSQSAEGDK